MLFFSVLNVLPFLFMDVTIKSTFFFLSKLIRSSKGKKVKSKGVNGLTPYTISEGENLVAECVLLLYANSTCGKHSSHVFKFFCIIAHNKLDKALLTTSVYPLVYG